ncbi:hypothetical protein TSO221_25590 [Azospirillum sp. TSO22-1]|nr:hypothetical protein TSO221_25590 [Azospirillum sp. TSO22-1]
MVRDACSIRLPGALPLSVFSLAFVVAGVSGCGLLPPGGGAVEPAAGAWSCQPLGPIPGPEDIALDREKGLAYVSSTDRWAADGKAAPVIPDEHHGRIYRIDLKTDPATATDVTPGAFRWREFLPQGIDLLDEGPERRLFVVNRQRAADGSTCGGGGGIEILTVPSDGGPLGYDRTVQDAEALPNPNDVAATGDGFYVSNSSDTRSCIGQKLGALFGRTGGHVVRYDGSRFQRVDGTVEFANGLLADRASRRLFVASTLDGTVRAYRWDGAGRTEPDGSVPVRTGSGVDNLSWLRDGSILTAAHPSPLRFLLYSAGIVHTSPTQILHIASSSTGARAVREILRDDGERLSAGSAAALYESADGTVRRLLVGAVFADHLLLCRDEGPARP